MHAFDSWNWRDLTFRSVAERAGVGERTVYRHFPTERHLHDAVMQRLESEAGISYEDVDLDNLGAVTARVFASLQRFAVRESVDAPRDPTFVGVDARRREALLRAVTDIRAGLDRGRTAGYRRAFGRAVEPAQLRAARRSVGRRRIDGHRGGQLADGQGHRGGRGAAARLLRSLDAVTNAKNLIGRTVGRLLGLPPHTCEYDVDRDRRVPMRDGVELLADHYRPLTPNPAGTLLVRTPYGRGYPVSVLFGSIYAARGYHVVVQSVRGTFGSGGDFYPFAHEIDDGADTAAWLRDQPWFTGSFATMGASYLGFTQWALLTDPPPEMAAAIITVGPHDLSGPRWGTGSFGLNDFLGWNDSISHQEDQGRIRNVVRMVRARRLMARATAALPAGEARPTTARRRRAVVRVVARTPRARRPVLDGHSTADRVGAHEVPVLLLTGWQDVFVEQTLEQYAQLRRRDVPVAVTVGSWTHAHMLTKGAPTVLRESLAWLDTHLAGNGGTERSPVRIHVNHDGWLDLDDWPPAMPEQVRYLQPGGRLGDAVPPDTAPASTFTYDPADPTPTVGGRLLSPRGGYRNDDNSPNAPTC